MSISGSDNESGAFDRRRLGGLGYVAADAALFTYGLLSYLNPKLENDKAAGKGMMVTGAGWALGGAVLAKFGKQPVDRQLERVENKLYDFLRAEGVALNPDDLKHADIHANRNLAQKLEDFCYDNPTEVLNSYYGIAALGMLKSGIIKRDRGEITAASCVIAGALAGIFIREKSPQELEDAGMVSKTFQTKPLALSSGLYMVNNVGSLISARDEQKKTQDPGSLLYGDHKYLLKYMLTGSYVTSNILVGSGSKKAGGTAEERAEAQAALCHAAGNILAAVEPDQREELAKRAATYLVKQKELRLEDCNPAELAQQILFAMPVVEVSGELDRKFQSQQTDRALSTNKPIP